MALDQLLVTPAGEPYSFFAKLKEYPPHANPQSIHDYLSRYQQLCQMNLQLMDLSGLTPKLLDYYFELAKRYHADDLRRFASPKRYTLLICFIMETRKILLDYVIELHDQFITGLWRRAKHSFEERFQEYRQRAKKANDILLTSMDFILDRAPEQPITLMQLYQQVNERTLKQAVQDCYTYKRLEEKGLAEALCARYATLRRYFSAFVQLPFATDTDHKALLRAITIIRQLDAGQLKKLPKNAPCSFIATALEPALKNTDNDIHRPLWEISLAMAMREALRAGDLYLAESKQHISFWKLIYPEENWHKARTQAYAELKLQPANAALQGLVQTFKETVNTAQRQFERDDFAKIIDGRLQLNKDDKLAIPESVEPLQKLIEFNLPKIRIEKLLMEVDQATQFSQCFSALSQQSIRTPDFYRTVMAALIAQATNLGTVTMANSTPNMTVSQLRHMMDYYIRESTLKAANARIVNRHHQLPFSAIYGQGDLSSSDAQRFGIIASSLMGSFYPRYFGYYEKAVGIYTHVSDQYSVYSTKVISCSPREALYVLDGLLENNTILHPLEHTTDTAGYTEHVFALCYLLGFYFMPRIRDLKDQQLYKLNREDEVGIFAALMRKTADLKSVEEQWDAMVRVAASLKHRLTPAHVILQRLARSGPADRLAKAFTALGRMIKTLYILRYLTDPGLRRRVQMQLNRGEYRHKLSRWLFFANQGEFQIGDYEEIMNKASCLSLVSNAILYWNTPKISAVITKQRQLGEMIEDATLARISPLAYKHVIPNGTYFID